MRLIWGLPLLLALSGCWNENVQTTVRMGDVSVGQQLIDLKRALDEEAVSAAEYEELRAALMSLAEVSGRNRDAD